MQRLLDEAVQNRRNAQLPHTAAGLGYLYLPHRSRLIPPRQQVFFDARPMLPEVGEQGVHAHTVNSCCSFITLDPAPGRFHVLAFDHRFHQLQRLRVGVPLLAVTLDAPSPPPRDFRSLPGKAAPDISIRPSASPLIIEIRDSYPLLHVRAFSPVDGPTMPSADFCRPFPAPRDAGSTWQIDRSPRVMHTYLHAYACRIYAPCLLDRYRTLKIVAFSSGMTASYAISVRQASALPAASFRLIMLT